MIMVRVNGGDGYDTVEQMDAQCRYWYYALWGSAWVYLALGMAWNKIGKILNSIYKSYLKMKLNSQGNHHHGSSSKVMPMEEEAENIKDPEMQKTSIEDYNP